jgi:hypothetical protein
MIWRAICSNGSVDCPVAAKVWHRGMAEPLASPPKLQPDAEYGPPAGCPRSGDKRNRCAYLEFRDASAGRMPLPLKQTGVTLLGQAVASGLPIVAHGHRSVAELRRRRRHRRLDPASGENGIGDVGPPAAARVEARRRGSPYFCDGVSRTATPYLKKPPAAPLARVREPNKSGYTGGETLTSGSKQTADQPHLIRLIS